MIPANRLLLLGFFSSYLISVSLLLVASLVQFPLPTWGSYLDMALVVVIIFFSITIFGRGKANPKFETSHRAVLYILPILLVGMWVFRHSLDFNILLPGLAWRTFFFVHILPYGMTLWNLDPLNE